MISDLSIFYFMFLVSDLFKKVRHLTIFFSLKLQHCSCDHLEKVSFEILIVGLGSRPVTSSFTW